MALNVNMKLHQYIIVRVSDDMKNYTAWVMDPTLGGGALPPEPLQAIGNRTTSASTLATNIQNALPTLGT